MKNLALHDALPPDLRRQHWLMLGADACDLTPVVAARGAAVTTLAHPDDLPAAVFEVVVCQRLFDGLRHPLRALENICAATRSYKFS